MQTGRRAVLALVPTLISAAFLAGGPAVTARAQDAGAAAAPPASPARGPVTSMALPRFVSLKASEGNARRGPGLAHRIDWVFRHRDMPLLVTAEFGHWRRVEDRDGQGGWIHYSLLSGVRTVTITAELADLRSAPDPKAAVIARAENGVIGRLTECQADWCRISAGGEKGWLPKSDIWGVLPGEILE